MLVVSGARPGLDAAREEIRSVLQSGAALERFRQGIELQGGDPRVCDDPGILPRGRFQQTICADRPGIVARLDTTGIGRIVMDWGAGRARLEDPIDLGVGLELHARRGDPVRPGDPLVTAWYNDPAPLDRMIARLSAAWQIEESPPAPRPLILAEI
jgi:thymidine phosphorylase